MGDSHNIAVKVLLSMSFIIVILILVLMFIPEKGSRSVNYFVGTNGGSESIVFTGDQEQPANFYPNYFQDPYIQVLDGYRRRSSSDSSGSSSGSSGFYNFTIPSDDSSGFGFSFGGNISVDSGDNDEPEGEVGLPDEGCVGSESLLLPPENFKVAFIGDSGYGSNFREVLELIRDENVDLVLHQGDLGYNEGNEEAPQLWLNRIEAVLDPTFSSGTFPYFYSIGNHDVTHWEIDDGYREVLQDMFDEFGIEYIGDYYELGGETAFYYNNLFILLVGPGIDADFAGDNHAIFLRRELENSNSFWNICSWHKLMRDMQVGGKGDETGWGVYETCREFGAVIATAHEHSYGRTHVLSDMSEQIIADNTNPYEIRDGETFAFHSGLGGASIRGQRDDIEDFDHFASVYTSDQDADYGALFIEFYIDGNPRKARGYFKNIDGDVVDEFVFYNMNSLFSECVEEEVEEEVSSEGFVYADGGRLMLDGEEFRFIGFNDYGAANNEDYSCGSSADSGDQPDEYLDAMFSYLSSRGVNVLRFWYFQSFTGGGTDFSSLDKLIYYSNRYGIKLIPVLENQWDHCPGNIHKYSDWYDGGYLEPYGDYEISYRDYVESVVSRYRNETAIIMWQLMNEAESETEDGEEDPESLYDFTRDMSAFVKSIDSNHLVSLGTIGRGQPGTENENFVTLHSIDTIDIVEAHDYHRIFDALPTGSNSIANALSVAEDLNKPFFIGEAGISVNDEVTMEERASLFDDKISATFFEGGDGYLIWRWVNTEENYGQTCGGYCVTEDDPLLDVMERHASVF